MCNTDKSVLSQKYIHSCTEETVIFFNILETYTSAYISRKLPFVNTLQQKSYTVFGCLWLVGWLVDCFVGIIFVLMVVGFCTVHQQLKYHCALTLFCSEIQNIAPHRLLWRTLTLFQPKLVQPSKRAVPVRKTRMKQIITRSDFFCTPVSWEGRNTVLTPLSWGLNFISWVTCYQAGNWVVFRKESSELCESQWVPLLFFHHVRYHRLAISLSDI